MDCDEFNSFYMNNLFNSRRPPFNKRWIATSSNITDGLIQKVGGLPSIRDGLRRFPVVFDRTEDNVGGLPSIRDGLRHHDQCDLSRWSICRRPPFNKRWIATPIQDVGSIPTICRRPPFNKRWIATKESPNSPNHSGGRRPPFNKRWIATIGT
jgi:hypothetical protein